MVVASRVARAMSWLDSWASLRGVDTVAECARRHAKFPALRDEIRRSGTDSLAHFGNGYTFEGGLSLQQNPDELASLCLLLKERGPHRTYMEIGSASGGTCRFLHEHVGFERLLSLDDGRHPRAGEQEANFAAVPNLTRFRGDSHSEAARQFLAERLDGPLDVAFIDGDHSYEGVWADIELTLAFTRPGTLLLFHDTVACDGVRKAWRRAVRRRRLQPLAEYLGAERPLGIGVGAVV